MGISSETDDFDRGIRNPVMLGVVLAVLLLSVFLLSDVGRSRADRAAESACKQVLGALEALTLPIDADELKTYNAAVAAAVDDAQTAAGLDPQYLGLRFAIEDLRDGHNSPYALAVIQRRC